MDFQTADPDTPDGSWIDDVGNFFADIADSIVDFVVGDVPDLTDPDLPGTGENGSSDLPNGGFYQSMPGVDAVTGQMLDQTYQLIDDINDFGADTFGEQEWHDTLAWAQTDPYGLTAGIETPSEMQLRFAREDSAAEQSFRDWQDQQAADRAIGEADDLIADSEDLAWDTNLLLKSA